MANMSYCRFENTNSDLRDCFNALGEGMDVGLSFDEFTEKLSEDEEFALQQLIGNCAAFLARVNIMVAHSDGEDYV